MFDGTRARNTFGLSGFLKFPLARRSARRSIRIAGRAERHGKRAKRTPDRLAGQLSPAPQLFRREHAEDAVHRWADPWARGACRRRPGVAPDRISRIWLKRASSSIARIRSRCAGVSRRMSTTSGSRKAPEPSDWSAIWRRRRRCDGVRIASTSASLARACSSASRTRSAARGSLLRVTERLHPPLPGPGRELGDFRPLAFVEPQVVEGGWLDEQVELARGAQHRQVGEDCLHLLGGVPQLGLGTGVARGAARRTPGSKRAPMRGVACEVLPCPADGPVPLR